MILLLLVGSMTTMQAQDFRISKFKENLLDLTAASSGVRDRNGDACALIKFSARDDNFVFEPNLGVVKTEKKVGETWLYVPATTKRISIRHPQLGMLRDYIIPVAIEQKTVYEAEIEITNQQYLKSLLEAKSRTDTVRIVQLKDTVVYKERVRHFHATLGAGFNVTAITGPTATMGFQLKKHSIEAGVAIGLGKVKNLSLYQWDNGAFWGTYDYKPLRIFARYGYDIGKGSFVATPLVGVAFTNISSAELRRSSSGGTIFAKAHVVSGTVGCRFGLRLGEVLRLHVTPEYNIQVKQSKGYETLKSADSKIKAWGTGLNLNAGVIFYI